MGVVIVLGIAAVALVNGGAASALPAGHVAEGMYVYEAACVSCHGIYGEGTLDGPALVGEGSAVATMSRDELHRAIDDRTASMHAHQLVPQDAADTIAYLRQMQAYGGA